MDSPLATPLAKTERAKAQIVDFDHTVRVFFERTPYEIVSEVDPDADEEVWRFKLSSKLDPEISIRAGEILHNLRSSLDQMLAEIVVRITNRSDTKVEFPFGRDLGQFEAALSKQKKLPPEAIPLIRALQPYDGGDKLLWLLHSTNRMDKHRMGLVPVNLRTGGAMSYISLWYGQALIIGSRFGQHLTCARTIRDIDYLKRALEGRAWGSYGLVRIDPITGLPSGPDFGKPLVFDNLGPGTAEETYEFFTATPGTKIKTDFEPSFSVAFSNVSGLEREPAVHVLSQLRDLVERILLTFRRRFFP